jgi:pimeloyl-ACP methyl ester carboxylesterase
MVRRVTVRADDGVGLYIEDSGGGAPPLVFVYGLGCTIRHWKYPMAYFGEAAPPERRHRLIWSDFRGHGQSDPVPPGERLTIDRIVNDLKCVAAACGVRRATFLGQSMGASIVLALAHTVPELVGGIVLLTPPGRNPAPFLPVQPLSKWAWNFMVRLNERAPLAVRLGYALGEPLRSTPLWKLTMREVIRHGGFNPELARTDDIDEYIDKIFETNPNLFYDMAGDLSRFDVALFDKPLTCPTLIIAGGRDRIVPFEEVQRLMALVPQAELCLVPHGSHCPHFDDPGMVNRGIEAFLNKHSL